MDITLERILSLIPKKPNGDFVYGAKKEFCEKIGAPTNIVNEWVRGVSKSYRNYLYQIADAYHVSVEWLKGETDEKNPISDDGDGKQELLQRLWERPECRVLFKLADGATPDDVNRAVAIITALRESEGK